MAIWPNYWPSGDIQLMGVFIVLALKTTNSENPSVLRI